MKFVKFLRAPDFKEHLRTTACESKPLRCIVFLKAMANITSHGKVSFNYHLLFHYSRFNSTIVRNLFPCNSANNSFRKWQKPLLCYVVNWCISQKVKGVIMWYLQSIILTKRQKILKDFQTWISVPLNRDWIIRCHILKFSVWTWKY